MFLFPALTVSYIQDAAKIQPLALFIGRQIDHLPRGADSKKTEAAPSALPDGSTKSGFCLAPSFAQGVQRKPC